MYKKQDIVVLGGALTLPLFYSIIFDTFLLNKNMSVNISFSLHRPFFVLSYTAVSATLSIILLNRLFNK
jgi:hypothetical protein